MQHEAIEHPRRRAFFDHLRIVLTVLVILHHTASVYGGAGSWYWRDNEPGSNLLLVGFNAINQSFFMGFFFLLAGYFAAAAVRGKGRGGFLSERLLRLGVPLISYVVLISPFTHWLAHGRERTTFAQTWQQLARNGSFEPGPLWFVLSLLIFSVGLVIWDTYIKKAPALRALPGFTALLALALSLGVISFAVRLLIPVGATLWWLQLGYFPCYIALFAAGCAAHPHRILERITYRQTLPWLVISAAALLTLPLALQGTFGSGAFEGGMNINALYYAVWDPLVAWGILLSSLWAARRFWSHNSRATSFLARRAYAVFIIHPPVLVAVSMAFTQWEADPLLKFLVTGSLTLLGCILSASILITPKLLRRFL